MLEAIHLSCARDYRTLFCALSFRLSPGEIVQVTGQNGAGKSSLLRILTGLAEADEGEVCWQGVPLGQQRDIFHKNLLWLGHLPGIKTALSAVENLNFYHGDCSTAQCLQALAEIDLAGFEDVPVSQLSAGQQRRVALARLWLTCAKLWILDEPFTAIDAPGVEKITRQITHHARLGGMVVFTSHQALSWTQPWVRQITLQAQH